VNVPMHNTNCILNFFIEVTTSKNVVKQYAIRKAKIRSYAVRRFKMNQYTVRKGK